MVQIEPHRPRHSFYATPPLTAAEERRAFAAWRAGDETQLERILCANLGFVIQTAKSYAGHGVDLDDLIQEGLCGMWTAAQKFDYAMGYKFITYAVYHLRQRLNQAIQRYHSTVRVPLRIQGTTETTPHYFSLEDAPFSLPAGEKAEKFSFANSLALSVLPQEASEEIDLHDKVRGLLSSLEPREQQILWMYYGFEAEPVLLEKIGESLGISRERVRQIRDLAIEKLRDTITTLPPQVQELLS